MIIGDLSEDIILNGIKFKSTGWNNDETTIVMDISQFNGFTDMTEHIIPIDRSAGRITIKGFSTTSVNKNVTVNIRKVIRGAIQ